MPRFFVTDTVADRVTLQGQDALHLARSLRVKPGEIITVCDSAGTDHICSVESVTDSCVTAVVTQSRPSASETPHPVVLYVALSKGDKMEGVIQKGVEMGAAAFVPVLTARCISRPDAKSMAKKLERWNKIARAAAEQSGRGIIPVVEEAMDFKAAAQRMAGDKLPILFYENATIPLGQALRNIAGSVSLMTGPEGGFEPAEVDYAKGQGVHICSLGPRILRCETAPLAALAVVTAVMEIL